MSRALQNALRPLSIIVLAGALSACATPDHETGDRVFKGAAVGATAGIVRGLFTGNLLGGAIVGGSAGAAGGYVLDQLEKADN